MKIGYLYSARLANLADESTLPRGRSHRVHALIRASGYLQDPSTGSKDLKTAEIVAPEPATYQDLLRSHSASFVGKHTTCPLPGSWRLMASFSQLDAALRRKNDTTLHPTSSGSSEGETSDEEDLSESSDSSTERPRKRRRKRSIDDFGLSVSQLKSVQPHGASLAHHIYRRPNILRPNTSTQSLDLA